MGCEAFSPLLAVILAGGGAGGCGGTGRAPGSAGLAMPMPMPAAGWAGGMPHGERHDPSTVRAQSWLRVRISGDNGPGDAERLVGHRTGEAGAVTGSLVGFSSQK